MFKIKINKIIFINIILAIEKSIFIKIMWIDYVDKNSVPEWRLETPTVIDARDDISK